MTSKAEFDAFIEAAWNDHAEHAEQVATRLQASLALLADAERIAPYARLVTHVFGEHLARWEDGVSVLEAIMHSPGWQGSEADQATLARYRATLLYGAGQSEVLAGLSRDDQIVVLATVATAFLGQGQVRRAIETYQAALTEADSAPVSDAAVQRALAIGGNNLACGLEEKSVRDAFEDDGMVTAAEAGLRYWSLCGTWLNQERAEYRLASSLLKAGRYADAVAHAQACLAICAANDATPFEQFFGFALLAAVHRAQDDAPGFTVAREQARAWYAQIKPEHQADCSATLAELDD